MPSKRGVLIGSWIHLEQAAAMAAAQPDRQALAKAWGKSLDRTNHIILELRDRGLDCGPWPDKPGPKPGTKRKVKSGEGN
jgi:hypothetical protein